MSSPAPFVVAAPSNVPDVAATPEPGSVADQVIVEKSSVSKSAPFAGEFLTAMDQVVDFWAEPSYAQLLLAEQKRIHDFVVADKGTAKEALDGLLADWKKVFKEDGKLK